MEAKSERRAEDGNSPNPQKAFSMFITPPCVINFVFDKNIKKGPKNQPRPLIRADQKLRTEVTDRYSENLSRDFNSTVPPFSLPL